jgi:hypothetical protein
MPTEILITIGCEGSECGECECRKPITHYHDDEQYYCVLDPEENGKWRKLVPTEDGGFLRYPSCLAAESAARETREENERLWANLLNLTTGVLYLYNKATGAYNPKWLYVSKDALRSLYKLATKLHEEAQKG